MSKPLSDTDKIVEAIRALEYSSENIYSELTEIKELLKAILQTR